MIGRWRCILNLIFWGTFSVCVGCSGCGSSEIRVPKPRAYPRVQFPERNFTQFNEKVCPLTFQYPDYMQMVRKQNFFENKPAHPCWFDLDMPVFGATLHCSYSSVESGNAFESLVTDAFKIADQINLRANYMDEIRVANAHGITGLLMEFSGSAASPLHFYLTDSTDHFLKASLYFQSRVAPDSLAPITDFLRDDLAVIINTMQFNGSQ